MNEMADVGIYTNPLLVYNNWFLAIKSILLNIFATPFFILMLHKLLELRLVSTQKIVKHGPFYKPLRTQTVREI
jgi:hypothetical protein